MIKKRTARDFKFIRLLGEGSFSSVYLAVDASIPSAVSSQRGDTSNNDQHKPDGRPPERTQAKDESRVSDSGPAGTTTTDATTKTATAPTTTPTSSNSAKTKKVVKYAIKVCQKSHIKRQGKQMAIMREKEIMNILNQSQCKHFIRLYCTFQDTERLFFVMSYAKNGELLTYMLEHPLSLDTVRKFTLQLVTALEHLHRLHIVHRDLKPENILLGELMDLLISDFGSAQIYNKTTASNQLSPPQSQSEQQTAGSRTGTTDAAQTQTTGHTTINNNDVKTASAISDRRNSYVGTAQYVSPEMLKNREASNKSDLWALGVIIYQMITNVMPFDAPNEYLIYKKIQKLDYDYPDSFDGSARDLVDSLIKLDPKERLGAGDDLQLDGYQSIRRHCFISDVDSEQIMTTLNVANEDDHWSDIIRADSDLRNIDKIAPGLDETQMLRLLTDG